MKRFGNSLYNLIATKDLTTTEMTGMTQALGEDFAGQAEEEVKQETMVFSQDGAVVEAEREPTEEIPPALAVSAEDLLKNDIEGFLRRPVHMGDIEWKAVSKPLDEVYSISLPRDWLDVPMIQEKIRGFRYLRCTLVVELQVNAQPFNAGALLAYFSPAAGQMRFKPSNTAHFGGLYGYPHVIYKCGESTSVKLEIPYFPLISGFDNVWRYGTMGTFNVNVLSQLTGGTDVDGTIWIWAKDISLNIPTGIWTNPTMTGITQGLTQEKKEPGNIQKIASTLSGVTSTIAKVPGVGQFAAMAQPVVDGVGAIAAAFGWSKPMNPEFPTEIVPTYQKYMMNFNGVSNARMMALDAKNATDIPTSVFNTTEDEMAFQTIVKKPIYMTRFSFDSALKQNQVIWSWPVDATSCLKTELDDEDTKAVFNGAFQCQETYVSYLTKAAQYWRGQLNYHFNVIKTQFHSGRIRVTFVPGANQYTKWEDVDLNKCYSRVVDLRETSDFDVEVPFTYFQTWKATDMVGRGTQNIGIRNECLVEPTGMIYVSIVNALRRPDGVDPVIDIIVSESAGSDFQLAIPFLNPGLRIIESSKNVKPLTMSGQVQAPIYDSEDTGKDVCKETVGEVFTGFRQWLKRYTRIPGATPTIRVFLTRTVNDTDPGYRKEIDSIVDPYYFSSLLYRFYSGNIRILMATRPGGYISNDKAIVSIRSGVEASSAAFDTDYDYTGSPLSFTSEALDPLPEYEVPFYQLWNCMMTDIGRPVQSYVHNTTPTTNYNVLPYNNGTQMTFIVSDAGKVKWFRAIGENFSFGFLMGPPITILGNLK